MQPVMLIKVGGLGCNSFSSSLIAGYSDLKAIIIIMLKVFIIISVIYYVIVIALSRRN